MESRVFLSQLLEELAAQGTGSYRVKVHPRSLSVAVGAEDGPMWKLCDAADLKCALSRDESVSREGFVLERAEIE